MFSCKQQEFERPVFKTIDLCWGNGWTKTISVFIDSTKNVKIAVDELNKKKSYYTGQINDTAFIKINHLISNALTKKHEKEIGSPIPDGGISCVIVESTKSKNFSSVIFQSGIATELDSIVNILTQLENYKLNESLDSTFIFKSYLAIKLPPPLIETVKFVPPVIKNDIIEK